MPEIRPAAYWPNRGTQLALSPASAVCRVYNAVFTIEFMA
jgi:hypothetical protein